jgi:small subunit ribosomal protein S4e
MFLGKKGPTRHLKRHNSPKFWPIHRKEKKWTVRTQPGPHSLRTSVPVQIVLRDILKFASTGREAKILVKKGKFIVDKKTRLDHRYPVGIMDVVSLPDANQHFRMLPDKGGKLTLFPIEEEETNFKLLKITKKTTVKKGLTQLQLHDGRNILLPLDAENYKVGDVLKIKIPDADIIEHIPLDTGVQVIITGGRSQGRRGNLIGVGTEPGWKTTADIRTFQGDNIKTLAKYVFPVGFENPAIALPVVDLGEE